MRTSNGCLLVKVSSNSNSQVSGSKQCDHYANQFKNEALYDNLEEEEEEGR